MSDDKPTEPEDPKARSEETEDETEAESEDTEAEAEAEAAPSSSKEAPRERRTGKSRKKRRERERAAAAAEAARKSSSGTNPILFAVAGLAAGAAVGWFGHIATAKAKAKADVAPAAAASGSAEPAKSGPCAALEKELCAKTGDTSAACEQAKSATSLLTSGTCELALETVPAMVEKVKAARAVCDQLVARLCKDLTPVSAACGMVKEKTPSFPTARCVELNKNYEQVLAELKQMEEQGAIPGSPGVQVQPMPGRPPGGMPPGAMPPGHAPGDGHDH